MIQLLMLMLATTPGAAASSLPPGTIIGLDPRPGPMAAANTYLLPGKTPPCEDSQQAQRAAEERIKGYQPECLRPFSAEQKSR